MKKAYQLKIQLKDFKPSIYRTILVDPNINFEILHNYIQQLFGFMNYHLFEFHNQKKGIRLVRSNEDKMDFQDKIAKKVKLKDFFINEKDRINYTYDFGDDWEFNILLEKIIETNEKLPKVLRGKGGFLIEDCGGPWGLEELIEIYNKKNKTEALEMGYTSFKELEEELEDTILEEIDWRYFELSDN